MKKSLTELEEKAAQIAEKHPKTKAKVIFSPWAHGYFIEVATVDQAKALSEIHKGFRFSSGSYQ
jgi:hypothetical protein